MDENTKFRRAMLAAAPTVSDALRIAADYWQHYRNDPDFFVTMGLYCARDEDGRRCGCLATCAVQKIVGKEVGHVNLVRMMRNVLNLEGFELAIDALRHGFVLELLNWYLIPDEVCDSYRDLFVSNEELRNICEALDIQGSEKSSESLSWSASRQKLTRMADMLSGIGL